MRSEGGQPGLPSGSLINLFLLLEIAARGFGHLCFPVWTVTLRLSHYLQARKPVRRPARGGFGVRRQFDLGTSTHTLISGFGRWEGLRNVNNNSSNYMLSLECLLGLAPCAHSVVRPWSYEVVGPFPDEEVKAQRCRRSTRLWSGDVGFELPSG